MTRPRRPIRHLPAPPRATRSRWWWLLAAALLLRAAWWAYDLGWRDREPPPDGEVSPVLR